MGPTALKNRRLCRSSDAQTRRGLEPTVVNFFNDPWVHKTANVLNNLPKSQQSVECLIKDRDAPLAFYDFPAEHWNARGQKGTRRPAKFSLSKSRIVANREVEITRVPEALFGKRRYPNRCAAAIHRRWRLRHYYRGRLFKPDLEPAHQSPN